jgi:hypothetical protein
MSGTAIDWSAQAALIERDDGGSEMYFEFRTLAKGTLAELVAHVASLAPEERARLVLDRGPEGTLAVQEILALAARPDFPGRAQ